jgi:hypothetical protein
MDKFDIQVLLKDGSFADYQVQNERSESLYKLYKANEHIASFVADNDGGWSVSENPGDITEELQERIKNQLNGFRA